jgi:DNA-binding response OmpR family regulator
MRLLLIEDEQSLADALSKGLKHQGYVVDIAMDGEEGLDLADVHEYDLLILDLNLPGLDGLEVLQCLKTGNPSLLILILTARISPQERVSGLDLGADDYLIKPFHFDELCARVRSLLRRDLRVRSPVLRQQDLVLDPAEHTAWQSKRRLALTRREFSILEYLMRHPGEAINSLRQKLNDDARHPRYITTLIGKGYRLEV